MSFYGDGTILNTMKIRDLTLKGPKIVQPRVFYDNRGFFLEPYQQERYNKFGIKELFVQDNHSFSEYGVLRGMHFQLSPSQSKLVWVIYGAIFDVIVDIRTDSSTYGKWEGVILDDKLREQLFVPSGFAHGFCVLSPHAHVMYKVSASYAPEVEQTFLFNDPAVGIKWPIQKPIVSKRDQQAPLLQDLTLRSDR